MLRSQCGCSSLFAGRGRDECSSLSASRRRGEPSSSLMSSPPLYSAAVVLRDPETQCHPLPTEHHRDRKERAFMDKNTRSTLHLTTPSHPITAGHRHTTLLLSSFFLPDAQAAAQSTAHPPFNNLMTGNVSPPPRAISSRQPRSPRMRRASWMSLTMIVTRFPCIAHRLVSSKSSTRYASDAS